MPSASGGLDDEACAVIEGLGCDRLPSDLTSDDLEFLRWAVGWYGVADDTVDGLAWARGACAALDEQGWGELLLATQVELDSTPDSDGRLDLIARLYVAPAATVFLCPEHEVRTRDEMRPLVCGRDEACLEEFMATWPERGASG